MPIALQDPPQNSRNQCALRDGASSRLTSLLVSAPIDLATISDEIRSHPDLEALVMRLSASLVLSPEEPLATIEEAVVVLGAERLRVLIDLWSSAGRPSQLDASSTGILAESASLSNVLTPEMRYITNFLRCIGLNFPDKTLPGARLDASASRAPSDQIFALTDLFMRDFFSLLPLIQPGIRELVDSSRPNPTD